MNNIGKKERDIQNRPVRLSYELGYGYIGNPQDSEDNSNVIDDVFNKVFWKENTDQVTVQATDQVGTPNSPKQKYR